MDILKMKLEIDIEIGSQHGPDAYRNMVAWPHECDKLIMNNDIDIVNMDMKPLSDDNGLNIAMNNRHDTGLELTPGLPSDFSVPIRNTPPTEHFIGTQIQPEPKEKVIIIS